VTVRASCRLGGSNLRHGGSGTVTQLMRPGDELLRVGGSAYDPENVCDDVGGLVAFLGWRVKSEYGGYSRIDRLEVNH